MRSFPTTTASLIIKSRFWHVKSPFWMLSIYLYIYLSIFLSISRIIAWGRSPVADIRKPTDRCASKQSELEKMRVMMICVLGVERRNGLVETGETRILCKVRAMCQLCGSEALSGRRNSHVTKQSDRRLYSCEREFQTPFQYGAVRV